MSAHLMIISSSSQMPIRIIRGRLKSQMSIRIIRGKLMPSFVWFALLKNALCRAAEIFI